MGSSGTEGSEMDGGKMLRKVRFTTLRPTHEKYKCLLTWKLLSIVNSDILYFSLRIVGVCWRCNSLEALVRT